MRTLTTLQAGDVRLATEATPTAISGNLERGSGSGEGLPLGQGLPPLPALDENLYAVHYSCERHQNSKAETPPVSAIVVRHVLTGNVWPFAAIWVAQEKRIPLAHFPRLLKKLERRLLHNFFQFVAAHPDVSWLHWGMNKPSFSFEALSQRACLHCLRPVVIPSESRFDLANYLKRRYGDDYAPDPRLWHVLKRNRVDGPALLSADQAKEAWEKGEYGALVDSLSAKVTGLVDLLYRVHRDTFLTGGADCDAAESVSLSTAPDVTLRAEPRPVHPSSVSDEERVRGHLTTDICPRIEGAMAATGLTEQKIRRTESWKEHEDRVLDDYLLANPGATTPEVHRALGFSPAKTVTMRAWTAHMTRRNASRPVQKPKERPLTNALVESRPDARADTPCAQVDNRDALYRRLVEEAEPDTRALLNRLSHGEREALLEALLVPSETLVAEGRPPEEVVTVLLQVTASWLDELDQRRRRGHEY